MQMLEVSSSLLIKLIVTALKLVILKMPSTLEYLFPLWMVFSKFLVLF